MMRINRVKFAAASMAIASAATLLAFAQPEPGLQPGAVDELEVLAVQDDVARAGVEPLARGAVEALDVLLRELAREGERGDVRVVLVGEFHAATPGALPPSPSCD